MPETPQQTAARADFVMAKCRSRGNVGLADIENLRNAVHALADECQRLAGAASATPTTPVRRAASLEDLRVIDTLVEELREAEAKADLVAERWRKASMPPNPYDHGCMADSEFHRKLGYRYHQLIEEITATALFHRIDDEEAADVPEDGA